MSKKTEGLQSTTQVEKTIQDFEEKSYLKNRMSLKTLVGENLLKKPDFASQPELNELYESDLLLYSTEYRKKVHSVMKGKKCQNALNDSVTLNESVSESLNEIGADKRTLLAQNFLNTSVKMLIESKDLMNAEKLDASFEGVSIEFAPCYSDNGGRSDNYQYNTQQVQICFRKFPQPLSMSNSPSVLLAHELTHAVDDIYNNVKSVEILFQNLNQNAYKDKIKQVEILRCAAGIVDDTTQLLEKSYLHSLENYINEK